MKQTIQIEVDIPEGYEAVRYDFPRKGDYFLEPGNGGGIKPAVFDFKYGKAIIVKKKPWAPKEGEEFWVISATGGAVSCNPSGEYFRNCVARGNYFKSWAAAKDCERALIKARDDVIKNAAKE